MKRLRQLADDNPDLVFVLIAAACLFLGLVVLPFLTWRSRDLGG